MLGTFSLLLLSNIFILGYSIKYIFYVQDIFSFKYPNRLNNMLYNAIPRDKIEIFYSEDYLLFASFADSIRQRSKHLNLAQNQPIDFYFLCYKVVYITLRECNNIVHKVIDILLFHLKNLISFFV